MYQIRMLVKTGRQRLCRTTWVKAAVASSYSEAILEAQTLKDCHGESARVEIHQIGKFA